MNAGEGAAKKRPDSDRRRARVGLAAVLALLSMAPGGGVELERVATVEWTRRLLARGQGFDFDQDGAREFVMRRSNKNYVLDIYESAGNDMFTLAHSLDLSHGFPNFAFATPRDAGDADGDGLTDLVVYGQTNVRYLRIYESVTPNGYPTTTPVWEPPGWTGDIIGGVIADTDRDGQQEIVLNGGAPGTVGAVGVFENTGNNSYAQSYLLQLTGVSQSLSVMDDLDRDGRDEIMLCGTGQCLAIEATGDNTYQQVWLQPLIHTDGQAVNAGVLEDGGDLDGDGLNEFLVGGVKSISAGSDPFLNILYLFESTANDTFVVATTFIFPEAPESPMTATIADVDGDGNREIVIALQTGVSVYKNTGDNAWKQIWLGTTVHLTNFALDAGDHDADGKEEIIFREANNTTGIFEIDPLDAVDTDTDGFVDAIDNCPMQVNGGQQDVDADGVGDACDNCLQTPNPSQGPAPLGQTLLANDAQMFVWSLPVEVLYARGPISGVATYTTDVVQALPQGSVLTDATQPAAGAGFYYLVRPDCPAGSWQTTPGAEPGRDAVLP